jgi:hypothetical protein
MTLQRAFKLRSFVNGKGKKGQEYIHYSLTVPNEIAERIPDGMMFVPRMTEEGILYEPKQPAQEQIELPEWAQANDNGNGEK